MVDAMMQCNEVDLAAEYQKAFGLPSASVSVDDVSLAARREQWRQNHYQLQLPDESVMLVTTEQQLSDAQAVLCCQSRIGFDMEWKPGTGSTHASTLQVQKDKACLHCLSSPCVFSWLASISATFLICLPCKRARRCTEWYKQCSAIGAL